MTTEKTTSHAEVMDRITLHAALCALVLSMVTASSAASYLVSPETGRYLGFLEKGLAVLVVLIAIAALPLLIKKRSLQRRPGGSAPESFINDVAKRSLEVSWGLTLVVVVLLDLSDGKYIADLPSIFIMDLIKTILLGSFSLSFFFLNRSVDMDETEEGLAG